MTRAETAILASVLIVLPVITGFAPLPADFVERWYRLFAVLAGLSIGSGVGLLICWAITR